MAIFCKSTIPKLLESPAQSHALDAVFCPFSLLDHQSLSEPSIPLQMPFAAHRLFARVVPLHIQQKPNPPSSRSRSRSRVMPRDASLEIVGPSDVRSISVGAAATEHVNEAFHHRSPLQKGEGPGVRFRGS